MAKNNRISGRINRFTSKSLKHSFSGTAMTSFGGISLLRELFDRDGFRSKIDKLFKVFNFRKEIPISHLFEQIMATMILGGTCMSDTEMLDDQYLLNMFGWKRIPDDGTYSERLKQFRPADVKRLRKHLRDQAFSSLDDQPLFITVDPTVQTVYGNQDGAAVGYNPSRQGRKSYFPFMAHEYLQGRLLDVMLRPGNTSSLTDIEEFITPMLGMRQRKWITFRLDKGCTSNSVLDLIHTAGQYYVAKAKLFSNVWEAISNIKHWTPLDSKRVIAEFNLNGKRHIVVEQMAKKKGEQLNLWGRSEARIAVIVTNRMDKPETIWRMYNKGAMVETAIKEIKHDFSALHFRTQSFQANEVFLILGAFAWNFIRKIRDMPELGVHKGCCLKKIRWLLFRVAAVIRQTGRSVKVRLTQTHPFQDTFLSVLARLSPA